MDKNLLNGLLLKGILAILLLGIAGLGLKAGAQTESKADRVQSFSLEQAEDSQSQASTGQNPPPDENLANLSSGKAELIPDVSFLSQSSPDKKEERLISLEFKNADIKTVLLMLAQECGLSVAVGDLIQGKITVNFSNVTLEEALNALLRINGCDYVKEGRIYRIVRSAQTTEKPEIRTVTTVFNLAHIDGNSAETAITPLLSANGKIQVFSRGYGVGSEKTGQRSDILIITDIPEKMDLITMVLEKIDTSVGQVMVEARIIEVSLDDDFDLGIKWTVEPLLTGSKIPTTFPLRNKLRGTEYLVPRPAETNTDFPQDMHFPYSEKDDFTFGTLSFGGLQAALKMLESKGTANLLSCPRVVTLDNQEAKIVIGEVIPIPNYTFNAETGSWTISGYSSEELGITLSVTPHILKDGYIVMKVAPEVSEFNSWVKGPTGEDERPRVSTRKVDTQIKVPNGDTIVIGGLLKDKKDIKITKVPFLGNIPLLGLLFTRKDTTEDTKKDLLIFITPRIINETNIKDFAKERDRIEKSLELLKKKK